MNKKLLFEVITYRNGKIISEFSSTDYQKCINYINNQPINKQPKYKIDIIDITYVPF